MTDITFRQARVTSSFEEHLCPLAATKPKC